MSDLYLPKYTRGGYGKYNKFKNFIAMEAGTDAFFLEDEANELQWIQNELRADLVRREYYSGVYAKENNDIIPAINILSDNSKIYNAFFVKPMVVNVNGYFIDVFGNKNKDITGDKLNYIKLPDAPDDGIYYDLVYLEACFTEVKWNSTLWYNGNEDNSFGTIENDLFDRRINGETNRRIRLNWTIRSSRIPMTSETLFDESFDAILTPAYGGYTRPSRFGFWNAPLGLDGKTVSDDVGLWIAGDGIVNYSSEIQTSNGYSYAIPLFKVIRRNTNTYCPSNVYGGKNASTSKVSRRPDGKFADVIYQDDIIDIRNIIRCDDLKKEMHQSFENLLLNKVTYETKPYSTFFGVSAISPDADTYIYRPCNKDVPKKEIKGKDYEYIPGVEQEAIRLKNKTYLSIPFKEDLKELTAQLFVRTSKSNRDIFSIRNADKEVIAVTLQGDQLVLSIHNGTENNARIVVSIDDIDYKNLLVNLNGIDYSDFGVYAYSIDDYPVLVMDNATGLLYNVIRADSLTDDIYEEYKIGLENRNVMFYDETEKKYYKFKAKANGIGYEIIKILAEPEVTHILSYDGENNKLLYNLEIDTDHENRNAINVHSGDNGVDSITNIVEDDITQKAKEENLSFDDMIFCCDDSTVQFSLSAISRGNKLEVTPNEANDDFEGTEYITGEDVDVIVQPQEEISTWVENEVEVITEMKYKYKSSLGKFMHIAVAVKEGQVEFFINNKKIGTVLVDIMTDFNKLLIGKTNENYFADGVTFDEIEVSKIYEREFSRIPDSVRDGYADITIDTQARRKAYTKLNYEDTYTHHVTYKSNHKGAINFDLTLPITMKFQDIEPVVYFDNESVRIDTEVNIEWERMSDEKWYCKITGLGAYVTYNLVIISNVIYPDDQGIYILPRTARVLVAEKYDKVFYTVSDMLETQEHNIGMISNTGSLAANKLIAYNPYINKYGFCTALKYTTSVTGKEILIPKDLYEELDFVYVYSVVCDGKNVLKMVEKLTDKFKLTLSEELDNSTVDIYIATDLPGCVYSQLHAGIKNIYKLEKIKAYGDGVTDTFIYRSDSKILSAMQVNVNNRLLNYAFVNGVLTPISILINGTFIHYSFDIPPANKSNIELCIVSEYDPLRSERLELIFDVVKEDDTLVDIKNLDGKEIVYYENDIFVTTDGYGMHPQYKDSLGIGGQELKIAIESTNNNTIYIKVTDPEEFSALEFKEQMLVQGLSSNGLNNINPEDGQYILQNGTKLISLQKNVHASSSSDEWDDYVFYMLNKMPCSIINLPMVDNVEFKIVPFDILSSSKCEIIYDDEKQAHIIANDDLPIATNINAYINYAVPKFGGSFLKTYNQLITNDAREVVNGFTNCSIDNKSFYSMTKLDKDIPHMNVFPFIINDGVLKLGILTTYSEDKQIYIDASYSAFGAYRLNNRYLLKHI